jgi:uncharacterized membrane protein required for colicin V production
MNINLVLIISVIIVMYSIFRGFKNGMIEEIVSLISLIVAVIIVFLFGVAVTGFIDRKMNSMVIAIIFILVIGFVFKLLSLLFMSLKIIANLPVIKLFDKVAGSFIGFIEGLIFIWIAMLIVNYFDFGNIGEYIFTSINNSSLLNILYRNNILEQVITTLIANNSYLNHLVTRNN